MFPPTLVPFQPIAIVGVGIRAPGGIDSLPSLWDTIIQSKSHHALFATDPRSLRRFNHQDFEPLFSLLPNWRQTWHTNLLDDTPGLDEAYFRVSKRDSAGMDAQLKLLLHVAHEALEDAGFTGKLDRSALDPASFGVYVGAAADQFCKDLGCYPVDLYHLVRNQRAFLSGQISHHFGLHGPAVSVDTASAGAMTAFNDACRALAIGECNAAIAGGVHVFSPVSTPPGILSLQHAGLIDPQGQSKKFLADGNGYCSGEACGLAVLKRLSDAIRDGDRIHGVIRGMGTGNMSSKNSILHPDRHLASVTLARAVASSRLNPADISFVELHGPGTQQGDLAELFSICSVLAQPESRSPTNSLDIGSVRTNLGHSEAASGAMGLFKVLAMMRYQRIPPQASFIPSQLNPSLHTFFDNHPLRVSDCEHDWNTSRRNAVVSSCGATGYVGFMVVESPATVHSTTEAKAALPLPFMISAKDPSTLLTLVQKYADWLDGIGASVPLSDISYSTTARRMVQTHFTLVQAASHAELAQKLRQDTVPIADASSIRSRSLAFCISGQGGPRLDPRQSSLYGISAAFTSAVNTCFRLAEDDRLVAPDDVEMLELFALQVGLAQMWMSWGLTPVALAGHSFGEYVTLVCAGVLTLRDALKLVGIRSSLVREKCVSSRKMAALALPLSDVRDLLRRQQTTSVELACINSEDRVTLAGTLEDLGTFHKDVLKVHPTARWQLIDNMKAAFHSRAVDPICEEFSKACKDITFHPSRAVVLSGLLGHTCLPGDDSLLQPNYLVRHCRETNMFGKAVLDYKQRTESTGEYQPDWIELGPHSTTIGFIPLSSGQLKLPSHYKGGAGWTTTLDTLTTLRAAGHVIDFVAFHRDINPAARHVDLPRYPFRLQPHSYPVRKAPHVSSGSPENVTYPRVASGELSSLLRNRSVANQPTCPTSVYIALVLAGCVDGGRKAGAAFRLSRLAFSTPFTSLTDNWLQARTSISSSPKATPSTFDVISKGDVVHGSMQVDIYDEAVLLDSLNLLKALVLPLQSIKSLPGTSILDRRLAYDLWSQTVRYGSHYHGLRRVWITEDGHQAWAVLSNEPDEAARRLAQEPVSLRNFSPILLDQACQLLDLLINTSGAREPDEIFVISQIDQVEIVLTKIHDSVSFESYASFEPTNGSGHADAVIGQVFTFDQQQRLVAAFRGVTMRRMKQHVSERRLDLSAAESSQVTVVADTVQKPSTPPLTPKAQFAESSDDHLRARVSDIVRTTLGIDHVPLDRKLAELGLDSLCAVEIGVEIGRLLPDRKLPGELLAKHNTTLATVFDALHLSSSVQRMPGSGAIQKSSTTPVAPKAQFADSSDDQLRARVSAIVGTTLAIDHVPVDRKLAELGLDSLCAVEIGVEIGRLLPDRKLPGELLAKHNTTLAMVLDALHLSSAAELTSDGRSVNVGAIPTTNGATSKPHVIDGTIAVLDYIGDNPELIQDKPGTTPLMLIHDSGGTALAYRLLGNVGCTLLGIHSPGLREGKGIVSILHAANQYAALARQWVAQSSHRPSRILVGGWSLGGVIAIALAAAHPDLVCGVILLDSSPPGTAPMTLEEAERLVPAADTRSSGGFGSLVLTQLKKNSGLFSIDANRQGDHRSLVVGLKAPVYLICATEPLNKADLSHTQPVPPGSCSAWMLSNTHANMTEIAWKEALGSLLIGTQRTAGDHFTIFTHTHAESTTRAIQQAIGALKARG